VSESSRFYVRKFLNSEEFGGTSLVEAHVDEIVTSRGVRNVGAAFSVGDCGRLVTLGFGAFGPERIQGLIEKIAHLRQAVVAFEKVLLERYKEIENAK
jgi:hypothetical protein